MLENNFKYLMLTTNRNFVPSVQMLVCKLAHPLCVLASRIQIIFPLEIFASNPESHRTVWMSGCDWRAMKKAPDCKIRKKHLAGDKQPLARADRLAAAAAPLAATWSRRAPGLSFRTCQFTTCPILVSGKLVTTLTCDYNSYALFVELKLILL